MTNSPDFLAKSANNSGEHYAGSAYCSGPDHIGDANKMVGLPSEEEIVALIRRHLDWPTDRDRDGAVADTLRDVAIDILALIRPAFEAKERELTAAKAVAEMNATSGAFWAERGRNAEAKLAQAVEALEPFACYHDDAEFLDHEGQPLPDDRHAGYVYLTMGDFRRARTAAAATRGETSDEP